MMKSGKKRDLLVVALFSTLALGLGAVVAACKARNYNSQQKSQNEKYLTCDMLEEITPNKRPSPISRTALLHELNLAMSTRDFQIRGLHDNASADFNKIVQLKGSSSGVGVRLKPSEVGDFELNFQAPSKINEIVIEIDNSASLPCSIEKFAHGKFVSDSNDVFFSADLTQLESLSSLQRITFRANTPYAALKHLTYKSGASSVHNAETSEVTLKRLFIQGSLDSTEWTQGIKISDTHFHPCSFSHYCAPLKDILQEMVRANVGQIALFGLQHNLVAGASPWALAQDQSSEIPFHYNDQGALGTQAQFSNKTNERKQMNYDAWPVSPTVYADVTNLLDFAQLKDPEKVRLHPYLSGLRIESFEGGSASTNLKYDVCSMSGDEPTNLAYLRAMDALFPAAVQGFAEYNLNKVVLFKHGAFSPQLDEKTLKCWAPFMNYLADTNRPIGFHSDLTVDQKGNSAYEKLLTVSTRFKNTTVVWQHAGASPEADPDFMGPRHIDQMVRFISTSPGKRFVEMSWPNGFFLSFEKSCDRDEAACSQNLKNYLKFINDNASSILFGSDQVSLFYPEHIGVATGETFVNHLSYLEGLTYPSTMNVQLGHLKDLEVRAGGKLGANAVRGILSSNFEGLMNKANAGINKQKPMAREAAVQFVADLLEKNQLELQSISAEIKSKRLHKREAGYKDERYTQLKKRLVEFKNF